MANYQRLEDSAEWLLERGTAFYLGAIVVVLGATVVGANAAYQADMAHDYAYCLRQEEQAEEQGLYTRKPCEYILENYFPSGKRRGK